MMFDVRMLSEKITNLDNKVEANDKKHAAAITELRTFFVDQNLVVVDSVGDLKKSIDAVISHVNPMVDREEKVKKLILKWSLPIIGVLLAVIIWGDKASILLDILKAAL